MLSSLAEDRQFGLRIELEAAVEQALRGAELEQGRRRLAAVGQAVVGEDEPGARAGGLAAIFDQGAAGGAPRGGGQAVLAPRAGGELAASW